jgi:hypothetical protein
MRKSNQIFKKITMTIFILLFAMYCSSSAATVKPSMNEDMSSVSYEKDVLPIMQKSCTPCHFPDKGRVRMLDSYEATKEYIDEILTRIQLPQTDKKFMPFKQKKTPLTAQEIDVFKNWAASGMAE